jgi:hypothetical protein
MTQWCGAVVSRDASPTFGNRSFDNSHCARKVPASMRAWVIRPDRLGDREPTGAACVLDHELHARGVTAGADVGRKRDPNAAVDERARMGRARVLGGEIEEWLAESDWSKRNSQ